MDVNTTLRKLCLEEVPLSEYLQVPNGSSYNLLTLQSHICQIKWNDVTMELSREFNITQITMYLTEQVCTTSLRKTCYNTLGSDVYMMTSSNGNIFRVTERLCGEFTGHR